MIRKALLHIKNKNGICHDENQYLNLIEDIIENNEEFVGRNGTTLAVFGSAMHFSLENNTIPYLTTKKLAHKTCLKELLWFISGKTDNGILQEKGIHIWDGNTTRDFLDKRGLTHYKENDMGETYGFNFSKSRYIR